MFSENGNDCLILFDELLEVELCSKSRAVRRVNSHNVPRGSFRQ